MLTDEQRNSLVEILEKHLGNMKNAIGVDYDQEIKRYEEDLARAKERAKDYHAWTDKIDNLIKALKEP